MTGRVLRERLFLVTVVITVFAVAASIVLAIWARTSVEIGVLVALVTLLLTFGASAFVSLRLQLDEIDDRRIAGLPLHRLPLVPEVETAITGLVRDVADIKQSHGVLMTDIATNLINEAAEQVESLADGVFVCGSEDELPYVRKALADTKKEVRAIAARGPEWWDSAEANAYWHAYEEVAQRIRITRIFISTEVSDSAALKRVVARHAQLGMTAHVISSDRVPTKHILPLVIFDDRLVHKAATGVDHADGGFSVQFSTRPADIQAAEETFHVVLDLAQDVEGPGGGG